MAVFVTQYISPLLRFVPNFRILSQVVAEKTLTEKNVHLYKKATEGKTEKFKKEGKIRISIFILIYTIHFAYLKVYTKFENRALSQVVTEKSLTEKKFTDKQTDRQTDNIITEKAKTIYPLYTSYQGGYKY